ncbi:probable Alpha-soluble NSF attachment protein [Zygosaccharomyces bailii]|nr:probable Alpha-soluble NSF attachment protein [Zygosaccharomyces bailii]
MSDPAELIRRAEKKGVPSSGFMKVFGASDTSKFEEAGDLCIQAANLYKLRKDLKSAGEAFTKAANYQLKAGSDDEAGSTYVEGYKSYKSSGQSMEAINSLQQAVEIFTKRGQFRRGANYEFEMGELLETGLNDYPRAIECYETAGEWYSQDQALALANKCLLRCADLKALNAQYLEASEVYAKLIKNSMGNRLSQWSLKDYYFKMGLCQLAATDSVAAGRTLAEGRREDPNFAESREAQLLQDMIEAVGEGDSQVLSDKVFAFDKYCKLDKWKTTIMLKIKESITEAEDDLL